MNHKKRSAKTPFAANPASDPRAARVLKRAEVTEAPKSEQTVNPSGMRTEAVRVKTAFGRSVSSTSWLRRQLNDPYVRAAKTQGYRSRAAYKIIEIDRKYKLLRPGANVIDLGAAPGGWTQVCVEKIRPEETGGKVIAIDFQPVENLTGAEIYLADFSDPETEDLIFSALPEKKADCVLSDMAPFTCGVKQADQIRIYDLAAKAARFSLKALRVGGCFVCKLFEGGMDDELRNILQGRFKSVKHFKPLSSRKDSSEIYLIASGFLG